MTLEEFKAKYPDIYQAIYDDGSKAGFDRGFREGEKAGTDKAALQNQDAAKTAGADAERERIKGVQDQLIPGHEVLVQTLMFDGKTTGPEAAVKILASEKKLRTHTLAAHRDDSPDALPDPSTDNAVDTKPKDADLPVEERAKAEWDKDPKVRKEFDGDYDAYLAAEKAISAGRVKILGKK